MKQFLVGDRVRATKERISKMTRAERIRYADRVFIVAAIFNASFVSRCGCSWKFESVELIEPPKFNKRHLKGL